MGGWTFVWTVTAVGAAHICLRKAHPQTIGDAMARHRANLLCAAPTVLLLLVNCASEMRSQLPRNVRVLTAGAPPAAATIERIEGEFGWSLTHLYGLTETSPFVTICEPRSEHAYLDPGMDGSIPETRPWCTPMVTLRSVTALRTSS